MTLRIAVDSSVIVKWFKKGEEFEEEALKFRDDVFSGSINAVISEWVYLEVVRGLVKIGLQENMIDRAYDTLKEAAYLGFIEVIPVSNLLDEAKKLEIRLRLYASDAVNLATALKNSINMLSEDRHLHRKSVGDYLVKRGLRVFRLKDLYKTR
ncbi:PIN domain-containing protein [Candidatus Bathyarchaeota archaeon]|nr:MAG: PIN domain-containing protein [Candidatus Bathyarchaeota archaeon]